MSASLDATAAKTSVDTERVEQQDASLQSSSETQATVAETVASSSSSAAPLDGTVMRSNEVLPADNSMPSPQNKVAEPMPKSNRDYSIEKVGTPAVTPEQPSAPLNAEAKSYKEHETTLSLDKAEAVSDLEKSPPSDRAIVKSKEDDTISARADPDLDNAEDSSNDDSSYFADPSHLPEPNSGRRFSWSSHASAQNSVTRQQIAHAASRESDASLSLSDDSDEHLHHSQTHPPAFFSPQQPFPQEEPFLQPQRPYPQQQQLPFMQQQQPFLQQQQPYPQQQQLYSQQQQLYPQQQHQQYPQQQQQPIMYQQPHQFIMPQRGGVPELYPEQIMPRMHSVSSLVSTSSHNSSASDTSVQDELQNVAVQSQQRVGSATIPSGRRSPILGEHPPSRTGGNPMDIFASPSTVNPGPSPPTILQSYSADGHIPHPQPHSMTPGLAAWAAASQLDQRVFGEPRACLPSSASAYSRDSDLAYSGDSDAQPPKQHAFGEPARNRRKVRQRDGNDAPQVSSRAAGQGGGGYDGDVSQKAKDERGFTVYWQRWLMLMYMSVLNLLSDWTCYSVAPIALLTEEAFGNINAEQLVVVFLCANGVATACEPIILSRLGLRRTVLFGSLLLMIGSIIKSGGMPPIIQADLKKGEGEWRVYLGFFIVGLSQPLYQCTPALLSASWFPEAERTLATGVALNANQLGIGFAFIFGTLLVGNSDDIPKYFSLLSILSTLTFLGTLIQFDDAPPTPPSDTARVMRGTLEVNLPTVQSFLDSVRNIGAPISFDNGKQDQNRKSISRKQKSRSHHASKSPVVGGSTEPLRARESKSDESESRPSSGGRRRSSRRGQPGSTERGSGRRESGGSGSNTRRRNVKNASAESGFDAAFHGLAPSPSPARFGSVAQDQPEPSYVSAEAGPAPSPMMPGNLDPSQEREEGSIRQEGAVQYYPQQPYTIAGYPGQPGGAYNPYLVHPQQYQLPYWDPRFAQFAYFQQQQQAQLAYQHGYQMPPPDPYYSYYNSYQHGPQLHPLIPEHFEDVLPAAEPVDEGAEPVITITAHQLAIDIRDDQIWLSTRACLARPGFIHSLVAFTVSGIVINTLSTFMDYLVRLNGAGREYTGIVGGTFQFAIMISSLLIGKVCDKTRAYYSITIGMLVLGAFGLAECGVSLDADRGVSLRVSLICVALLVGPLQPVSTELGVDVVYPLSENTVLVIQQLFSNVLSAAFIPCFKAMKEFGSVAREEGVTERPAYTFSFYLLIVLHAAATVFFATFNGRYMRYEHELEKQAREEERKKLETVTAFHRIAPDQRQSEQVPLMPRIG